MAGNYAQLLDIINNPTDHSLPAWDNNNKLIEGLTIKQYLLTIIQSLTAGYQFMGVATPSTSPGTPDQNVFYIGGAGTYDNFGTSITIRREQICIFKWNGSWTNTPIEITNLDFVNVNDVNGQSTAYESASAGRSAVPTAYRKSGLNITYLLNGGWVTELFIGSDIDDWNVNENWFTIGPIGTGKIVGVDFSIEDKDSNILVESKDGHLKTKNFDSRESGKSINGSDSVLDLEDTNNNELAQFFDGHIRTKKFNSKRLPALFRNYQDKIISILGDSISTFGTPDSRNENGLYCYSYFPTQTCRYSENGTVEIEGVTYDSIQFDVKNTWWYKLINRLGAKLGINDSWRGMSISNVRGDEGSLSNQTRINHLKQHGYPDLILVYGGTNDAGAGATLGTFDTTPPPTTSAGIAALGNSTFADGVRTMLVRLMFTYPNAEIVVILPTLTTSYYTIENLDKYVEILKEACDYFGIRYIDIRTAGINYYNKSQYFIDGIHPNESGMDLLYKCIYNNLIFK